MWATCGQFFAHILQCFFRTNGGYGVERRLSRVPSEEFSLFFRLDSLHCRRISYFEAFRYKLMKQISFDLRLRRYICASYYEVTMGFVTRAALTIGKYRT